MVERTIHTTDPEESSRLRRLADLAEQDGPDMLRREALKRLAAEDSSFEGDVRRAIMEMTVSCTELAKLAEVDLVTFDDFRCGSVELPLKSFERVARRLGFELVKRPEQVGA